MMFVAPCLCVALSLSLTATLGGQNHEAFARPNRQYGHRWPIRPPASLLGRVGAAERNAIASRLTAAHFSAASGLDAGQEFPVSVCSPVRLSRRRHCRAHPCGARVARTHGDDALWATSRLRSVSESDATPGGQDRGERVEAGARRD